MRRCLGYLAVGYWCARWQLFWRCGTCGAVFELREVDRAAEVDGCQLEEWAQAELRLRGAPRRRPAKKKARRSGKAPPPQLAKVVDLFDG